mmetsp:Transcript_8188/g.14871  ORF Transcript_8188/g.14871 Transcript_8188/m.14871 type:complete len:629 (+) Transcript_8188:18-1904(+)
MLLFFALFYVVALCDGKNFTLSASNFLLNGEPHFLRSGSLHYSRVPASLWADRLDRMKALGLNTVQTYIPWNWHESNFEGTETDFAGNRDIEHFMDLVAERDMLLLMRPGPYICGEWDFGGFPARLLANPDLTIRTDNAAYMAEVGAWFEVLLPKLKPFLIENGGPIAMVQIENEFGSYGDVTTNPKDEAYLLALIDLVRKHLGGSVVLYTTDGGNIGSMTRGSLKGDIVLTLGDFGPGTDLMSSSIAGQTAMNSEYNPLMCTEYYTGWLTHFGEDIATTETASMIATMQDMIDANMSFNLYMAHGGTNFGFWAGANGQGGSNYQPDITSYDYNSPISEHGAHNFGSDGVDKFEAVQTLLRKNFDDATVEEPIAPRVEAYGEVPLTNSSSLSFLEYVRKFDIVTTGDFHSQEQLGQRFGFLLYSIESIGECGECIVEVSDLRDRAFLFSNGNLIADIFRADETELNFTAIAEPGATLDILVESFGRLNYGGGMGTDWKGIGKLEVDSIQVSSGVDHRFVEMTAEDLVAIETIAQDNSSGGGQRFLSGTFEIQEGNIANTFIDMSDFGQGFVFLNGFNLGKYWSAKGPVLTLYVPDEVLKTGTNEVTVLELENYLSNPKISFVQTPNVK